MVAILMYIYLIPYIITKGSRIMKTIEMEDIQLIGLSLKTKTTNLNGRSSIDCGKLWTEFNEVNSINLISGRTSDEILAVYYQYEGENKETFAYFIGCKVKGGTEIPNGMQRLILPRGNYQKLAVKGTMPSCLHDAWKQIWDGATPRTYQMDFEVYDERSKDWNAAEVDIYLSV
jgi:predicted transcriptional regulator YdeE